MSLEDRPWDKNRPWDNIPPEPDHDFHLQFEYANTLIDNATSNSKLSKLFACLLCCKQFTDQHDFLMHIQNLHENNDFNYRITKLNCAYLIDYCGDMKKN